MPRRALEIAAVLLGFTVLTIALTWPAVTLFGQGINAFGDVVVQMTTLTWDAHALTTDPLRLFDAPSFYPYAHTTAYSEHLIGETLIALPLFWLAGGDPAPAHNFNFLLSFVLTGAATYLLVRDLTGNRIAAVAAGIAYAFAGYRFEQSGHMQTLATEWFPLTLWALRRGLTRNHTGYLVLAAVCVVGMGLFSVYYLFFLALLIALYGGWWLLSRPRWRVAAKAALILGMAALLLVPLYWPYVQVNQELGFNRSVYEVQGWAADWRFYGNVLASNWLWATLAPAMIDQGGERELFPGLIITILAAAGLLRGSGIRDQGSGIGDQETNKYAPRTTHYTTGATHRSLRFTFHVSRFTSRLRSALSTQHSALARERWFYAILGGVAFVLTFGLSWRVPGLDVEIPLPYAALYDWVPGFSALRVPVRFVALLNLALAVLGGYGLAALLAHRSRRAALALALPLLALLTLEYVQVRDMSNNRPMRPPAPPPYAYLATHPGPVVELPMRGDSQDVWYTYWDTYDWQPLVNGFSSFVPPGTVEIARALATFPDPAGVALLQGLQVQHVLVHFAAYPAPDRAALQARLAASPALTAVFRQGDDAIYSVRADPWPRRATAALPPGGYLWLGRGSSGGQPALEALAYGLKYNRLPGAPLSIPADHVTGDLPIGYRSLPALPWGQAADVAVAPAGDPAGGAGTGAGPAFYGNALAVLYGRNPALLAHYDLIAGTSPYAPHGLGLPPGGVAFAPGNSAGAQPVDLLFAAFAPAQVTVARAGAAPARIDLAPGLTRYTLPAGGADDGALDLRVAAPGATIPPRLLAADVYTATTRPLPAGIRSLTGTLLLDLQASTLDATAGTITTGWSVVPRHPGDAPFTLTLDIYQKPFGTHPDGHLGSWSLPLPAAAAARRFTLTLQPAAKTATATVDGASTPVYAWQGPPSAGDFTASLTLLAGTSLLLNLPAYDFTLDRGRIAGFAPAAGALVLLPFAGP